MFAHGDAGKLSSSTCTKGRADREEPCRHRNSTCGSARISTCPGGRELRSRSVVIPACLVRGYRRRGTPEGRSAAVGRRLATAGVAGRRRTGSASRRRVQEQAVRRQLQGAEVGSESAEGDVVLLTLEGR